MSSLVWLGSTLQWGRGLGLERLDFGQKFGRLEPQPVHGPEKVIHGRAMRVVVEQPRDVALPHAASGGDVTLPQLRRLHRRQEMLPEREPVHHAASISHIA